MLCQTGKDYRPNEGVDKFLFGCSCFVLFFQYYVFCKVVLLTIYGLILYFLPPLVLMTIAIGPLMLQSFRCNASNFLYLQYSRYCTEIYLILFFFCCARSITSNTKQLHYILHIKETNIGGNSCVKSLKRT